MSGSIQGMDGQAGTAGADGVDGLGAADGASGANGTAGAAGQGVSATIASDGTGPLVATGGSGGGGGSGGKGGNSQGVQDQSSVPVRTTYGSGGDAGNAGNGGAGGDATASVLAVPDATNSLGIVALGGNGGSDNQDAAGVAGSTGQYERGYDAGTTGSYELTTTYDAGVGGHGGAGTSAGKGGNATAEFNGQTGTIGSVTLELDAQGGVGGDGGAGSDGGSGSDGTAATGGAGGQGGAGGDAMAAVAGWNVTGLPGAGVQFLIHSLATAGGNGGAGGRGGFAEHRIDYSNGPNDSHTATDTFGDGGNAGAGGNAGTATAGFTGNTIAGVAAISLDIGVGLGTAGQGGTGGVSLPPGEPVGSDITYVGQTPGQDGAAGTPGTGAIDISDNTLSVSGELDLTIGSLAALSGQGLTFTFTNNIFDGGGSGTFHIAAEGVGFRSVFNVRDHTLAVAGSPANAMTGFSTFTNDSLGGLFIDGAGSQTYNVTANGGGTPDEVVFQPGHGDDTVNSGGGGTLLIDLAGFGAALNSFAEVQADASDDGQGDAVIATPDGGHIVLSNLAAADLTAANFSFDAAPACYCRGTLIATPHGEVPVEALAIGDRLLTWSGAVRRLRWIGRRSYGGRFVAGNRTLAPVMIRAGALDDNVPARDLFVSPHHAMYLDGILVPASALVNGVSILQDVTMAAVDYLHLELDTHDIILANGAPAETFVDDHSRGVFHNAASYAALYPGLGNSPATYCAPRASAGYAVEAIRNRLKARAAWTLSGRVA